MAQRLCGYITNSNFTIAICSFGGLAFSASAPLSAYRTDIGLLFKGVRFADIMDAMHIDSSPVLYKNLLI